MIPNNCNKKNNLINHNSYNNANNNNKSYNNISNSKLFCRDIADVYLSVP